MPEDGITVRLTTAGGLDAIETIPAILALRSRGARLAAAKRAVEDVVDRVEDVHLVVARETDVDGLASELRAHGIHAVRQPTFRTGSVL